MITCTKWLAGKASLCCLQSALNWLLSAHYCLLLTAFCLLSIAQCWGQVGGAWRIDSRGNWSSCSNWSALNMLAQLNCWQIKVTHLKQIQLHSSSKQLFFITLLLLLLLLFFFLFPSSSPTHTRPLFLFPSHSNQQMQTLSRLCRPAECNLCGRSRMCSCRTERTLPMGPSVFLLLAVCCYRCLAWTSSLLSTVIRRLSVFVLLAFEEPKVRGGIEK